jgi:A/G-specific adenine glycosylase
MLAWFQAHGRKLSWRKKSATKFELVVSELMLQRTQAGTVSAFMPSFLKIYKSWSDIASANPRELGRFLRPLGLWRRRRGALLSLAAEMVKRRGKFPKDRKTIESLPGVGQYIASAILLFHHAQAEPLLDSNMARVLERYYGPRRLSDIRYDPYLQSLARRVLKNTDAMRLNWAILDLASLICVIGDPKCHLCPVALKCRYRIAVKPMLISATGRRGRRERTLPESLPS